MRRHQGPNSFEELAGFFSSAISLLAKPKEAWPQPLGPELGPYLLRAAVRDARTKRIDVAIAALDGGTDIGLWLLEIVNELEAAETSLRQGTPIKRQKGARLSDNTEETQLFAKLS